MDGPEKVEAESGETFCFRADSTLLILDEKCSKGKFEITRQNHKSAVFRHAITALAAACFACLSWAVAANG